MLHSSRWSSGTGARSGCVEISPPSPAQSLPFKPRLFSAQVMIAGEIGTRSGKQCRERWHNHLDPSINKSDWTAEEEALIRELHAKMGPKWAEMARLLPGRPDNSISTFEDVSVSFLTVDLFSSTLAAENFWNAMQAREKRDRSRSISSMSPFEQAKINKAKAAAQAAAVATAGGESPSHSMSRSSSSTSLNNARYTPYVVRSTPMTKSRSDSVSSIGALSSLRSSTSNDTLDSYQSHPASPYTPAAMGRSHSISAYGAAYPPQSHSRHPSLADQQDVTEVLVNNSILREPFIGNPSSQYRRPHAYSSPPLPTGLYQGVEAVAAFPQQPSQPTSEPVSRAVPALPRLQIGSGLLGSGLEAYGDSPLTAVSYDSRFNSPADAFDPQQQQFMSSAGPLVYEGQGSAYGPAAYLESSPQAQVYSPFTQTAPYIHPHHLSTLETLDEQHVYEPTSAVDMNGEATVVDAMGNIVSPAYSNSTGSCAPSPQTDSGYSSFGYHSHRSSIAGVFDSGMGRATYGAREGGDFYPNEQEQEEAEGPMRPPMSRRDTAPSVYGAPPPPVYASPNLAQDGGFPSSAGAHYPHHRHTPSLPNPSSAYDLTAYDAVGPTTYAEGSASATLPSSATFPSSRPPLSARSVSGGRPRAHSRPTPPSAHRTVALGGSYPAAASPQLNTAPGLAAPFEMASHYGSSSAYVATPPPPPPSHSSSSTGLGINTNFASPSLALAVGSEGMSRTFSSPVSEAAARFEGFRLGTGSESYGGGDGVSPQSLSSNPNSRAPSPYSGGGSKSWLPRSTASLSFGDLLAADGVSPGALSTTTSEGELVGMPGTVSRNDLPTPSSGGGVRPAHSRVGSGLAVDETGRATLPF